uniref:UPAR/Ly6 domain-containing protein n=1 Tax=Ciona savignyi TaxID=51511 RepID=H2ZAI1_CIOSA
MKLCLAIGLALVVCAAALDDLSSGAGSCSLCVQKERVSTCCQGNVLCSSVSGSLQCDQTVPMRDDYVPARSELASALYDRGTSNFCSICCGLSDQYSDCCSARNSCTCTANLRASCID